MTRFAIRESRPVALVGEIVLGQTRCVCGRPLVQLAAGELRHLGPAGPRCDGPEQATCEHGAGRVRCGRPVALAPYVCPYDTADCCGECCGDG